MLLLTKSRYLNKKSWGRRDLNPDRPVSLAFKPHHSVNHRPFHGSSLQNTGAGNSSQIKLRPR